MVKKILAGIAILLALFLIAVAMQPADMHVERSATIAAPPAKVFGYVNDLHNWESWSPWAKLDPAAKVTYQGPQQGVGASYTWSGNSEVGEGTSTITESRPDELVKMKLEFVKPFAGTSDVDFKFQPDGEQTKVTWTMDGKQNFMCKAMGMFIDMDKMMGKQFEEGLDNLNAVVKDQKPVQVSPDADER